MSGNFNLGLSEVRRTSYVTFQKSSEGLGEMFEGESANTCTGKKGGDISKALKLLWGWWICLKKMCTEIFLLVFMGG